MNFSHKSEFYQVLLLKLNLRGIFEYLNDNHLQNLLMVALAEQSKCRARQLAGYPETRQLQTTENQSANLIENICRR